MKVRPRLLDLGRSALWRLQPAAPEHWGLTWLTTAAGANRIESFATRWAGAGRARDEL